MLDLALKMLLGDRAKYIMLHQRLDLPPAAYDRTIRDLCGIMQWSGSTLDNVGAPIWVVDRWSSRSNDTRALSDNRPEPRPLGRRRGVGRAVYQGWCARGCAMFLSSSFNSLV